MSITATELKNNLGKYLTLAEEKDIYITKNNKVIARLTKPFKSKKAKTIEERMAIADSLIGCIPDDGTTLEEIREERLSKI